MPSKIEQIPAIAVIGGGIRGAGLLERILAYSIEAGSSFPLHVHLIEPRGSGPEQFALEQPDYLLLNIVAGQVSLFPDALSLQGAAPTKGPSLFEWAVSRGLRLAPDAINVSEVGRDITASDFLPRRLMGEYLRWCTNQFLKAAPPWVSISWHSAAAIDLSVGQRSSVQLDDGSEVKADYVFLTLGSFPVPKPAPSPVRGLVDEPYPLPEKLKDVRPGEVVAIAGLGLSMVDAVLALTLGRGGEFEKRNGKLRYVRSGLEPLMLAFSRSGMPYRSRPALGAPLRYHPVLFTCAAIDHLRADKAALDFDADVLPLLLGELRIAYQRARRGAQFGWREADIVVEELRRHAEAGTLDAALRSLEAEDEQPFDPTAIYFGRGEEDWRSALIDSSAYQSWFNARLTEDLAEAEAGVASSPLKAALEACREFRDIIRHAVDYGGLTKASLSRFYPRHSSALNRIVVGPQKERTAEILALMEQGLLRVPFGSAPTVDWSDIDGRWQLRSTSLAQRHEERADWLYRASIGPPSAPEHSGSLIGPLIRRGYARRLLPRSNAIRTLDVDQKNHPVGRNGRAQSRLWLLGPLAEGAVFYNGFLPSADKFDRSARDADRAVASIFADFMASAT